MELYDHSNLRDACRDEGVFVILSWSLSGAHLESSSKARIFRHLYVIMLLILGDVFLTFRFDLDYGNHTFDDGWFHVTPFPTYHISNAILGHIPFSIEICISPLICMTTPNYEMDVGLMIWLHFALILRWGLSWVIRLGPYFMMLSWFLDAVILDA